VRGAENYKYDNAFPAGVPQRNTILPFTRNMMASMDFTPVTFSDSVYPHVTTYAHELATSVVFESGWQHLADKVSAYTSLPAGPKTFLQQVPTTWDDTRYVQGTPGQLVVLARRKGKVWYVAGIAGDSQTRNLTVPLTFLDSGSYTATQIADGSTDRTFSDATTRTVTAADSLTPSLRGNGGFVARLVPAAGP
jgi:alpha-glucosidase